MAYFWGFFFFLVTLSVNALEYVYPNEDQPINFISQETNTNFIGDALSVGSERVYFLSLLYPRAARVFIADKSEEIMRFHKINLALIAASRNRKDYLSLRFARDFKIWNKREQPRLGLSQDDYVFWQNNVVKNDRFATLYRGLDKRYRIGGVKKNLGERYKGVNYLEEDSLFSRIKAKVMRGDFIPMRVDMDSELDFARFQQELSKHDPKFSVLDLSNIPTGSGGTMFSEEYISRERLYLVLDYFKAHSSEDARILYTSRRVLLGEEGGEAWEYFNSPLMDVVDKKEKIFPLSNPAGPLKTFFKKCSKALKKIVGF